MMGASIPHSIPAVTVTVHEPDAANFRSQEVCVRTLHTHAAAKRSLSGNNLKRCSSADMLRVWSQQCLLETGFQFRCCAAK